VLDDVEDAGKVAAMRAKGAFRMSGGARCVNDEGRGVGRKPCSIGLELRNGLRIVRDAAFLHRSETAQLGMPIGEHRPGIDHQDVA
jgi:hypothetical protein